MNSKNQQRQLNHSYQMIKPQMSSSPIAKKYKAGKAIGLTKGGTGGGHTTSIIRNSGMSPRSLIGQRDGMLRPALRVNKSINDLSSVQ